METSRDIDTLAVHGGEPRPPLLDAVVLPIFQSSTYLLGDRRGYDDIRYLRLNNTPNHESAGAKIAALEEAEAGLVTSSGMAAITTTLLAHLRAGDHVLAQDCIYGGTRSFLDHVAPGWGIQTTSVSLDDPTAWAAALRPTTRVFYVEGTTNPLLQVGRLDEVVAFSRAHGLVSMIDNTFPTPVNFRPIPFGFDLSLHSATKYLGGHSDVVAGCVSGTRERIGRIRHLLNETGGTLDPHACFLLQRGMKTLPLRVRAQNAGALELAKALASHPAVSSVRYPGLPGDPSHERAARWFGGFGAVVSFVPKGGVDAAERVMAKLTIPLPAVSLGGVETLVTRPAMTSHAGQSEQEREAMGIPDALIRVSVGIESPRDLIDDFRCALEA